MGTLGPEPSSLGSQAGGPPARAKPPRGRQHSEPAQRHPRAWAAPAPCGRRGEDSGRASAPPHPAAGQPAPLPLALGTCAAALLGCRRLRQAPRAGRGQGGRGRAGAQRVGEAQRGARARWGRWERTGARGSRPAVGGEPGARARGGRVPGLPGLRRDDPGAPAAPGRLPSCGSLHTPANRSRTTRGGGAGGAQGRELWAALIQDCSPVGAVPPQRGRHATRGSPLRETWWIA